LDVTLTVDRDVVDPTNPVRVTIIIVNRDSRLVKANHPLSYACRAPYIVLDQAGTAIALPGRLCLAIGYAPRDLAPGDSITITDKWSGDVEGADEIVKPAPPGSYQLVARVVVDGREVGSAPVAVRANNGR